MMGILPFLTVIGFILLLPAPAYAWGPATHLEFALATLKDLVLVAPAVAALLKKYTDDFLYGNLAADITVGKNFSPYHQHCHNWQVAFVIMEKAEAESTRAFAWGYLAHLAADIVAHNYFIPFKTVQHFRGRKPSHAYWEMRFDTRMSTETWRVAKSLSTRAFAKHDRHLRKILTGPLFSFRVNKQLFNSMLRFTQILQSERAAAVYARSATKVLTEDEVREVHTMAVSRILNLLADGQEATCVQADPTGHRNLLIAGDIRKRLRSLDSQNRLENPDLIGERFRPIFREAMGSKLALPSMLELTKPGAALPSVHRRRSKLRLKLQASRKLLGRKKKAKDVLSPKPKKRRLLGRKKKPSTPPNP